MSFPREEDLDEDEELLDTSEPLLRTLSCELLLTEVLEFLAEDEPEFLVEDEPEFLEDDVPELLVEELLDDERVCDDVVLPLEPEERLSCEYESTGDAIRANATADAIAMFRMFFMMIRC